MTYTNSHFVLRQILCRRPPMEILITIAYVIFCQQVLNIDLPFGSICRSSFGTAPPPGQLETSVCIRQTSNRSLQILLRDVAEIYPGNLPSVSIWERTGRFRRTQLGSIGKDRDQVAFDRIFQFRFQPEACARQASETAATCRPEPGNRRPVSARLPSGR